MKVTVSSTSMMKPILYLEENITAAHPQRITGLLELSDKQRFDETIITHPRPKQSCVDATPVPWHSFLQIPNSQAQPRSAVFGFQYDGNHTWYKLWNSQTKQASWVMHEDGLDYQPYAIIAMDALVSLLPDWNKEHYLHLSPASETTYLKDSKQKLIGGKLNHHDVCMISDAATTTSGQLWFLVTIKGKRECASVPPATRHLHTGWLPHKCAIL